EVIEAACDVWSYRLPPENRIARRCLARQIQRSNGIQQWVISQPQLVVDLIRNRGEEELEFRLQIECNLTASNPTDCCQRDESTSALETSSQEVSSTHSVNPGRHDAANNATNDSTTNPPATRPNSGVTSIEHGLLSPISPTSPTCLARPTSSFPASNLTDLPATFQNGVTALSAGSYSDACTYFQQAADEFHKIGETQNEAYTLRQLGIARQHLKEYVLARSHLLAARALYESIGDECREEQLRCMRHLGRVEEDSGSYESALSIYQDVIRMAEQEGLATQHGWGLCYIGHLYNRTQRYDEALKVLKEVTSVCREPEVEGFSVEESGYAAEKQGHTQKAIDCYKRALQIFKTNGEGKWIGNENRVTKRLEQLDNELPASGVLRRYSVSAARMLNRSASRR
ncbi:hypothetical protein FRC07_010935, partial [Ceratobasidium sp. 392]